MSFGKLKLNIGMNRSQAPKAARSTFLWVDDPAGMPNDLEAITSADEDFGREESPPERNHF